MNNVVQLITPDTFDFRAYMAESEPQAKVISADTWTEELVEAVRGGHTVKGARLPWAKTHDHLRFRPGEVTVWQGMNGHGKSQLLGMACLAFAAQGERICIASFEMKPLSTLRRMLRQAAMCGQPSEQMARRFGDWLKDRVWLYDQQGTVKPEMIYAVIRYCAAKLDIKHIVIDSLMKCVRGEDDYNAQKDFVDMLTSLARDHGVHIHLVHHVRKGENEEKPPGKLDAKGSGSISDQVDQFLTVWRNKAKEKALDQCARSGTPLPDKFANAPDAMLICDKNRHGEWEGGIALWFHAESLQYLADSRGQAINIIGA